MRRKRRNMAERGDKRRGKGEEDCGREKTGKDEATARKRKRRRVRKEEGEYDDYLR
jgi:hypothetical protein